MSRITPNQANNSRAPRFRNLFYKAGNKIKRVARALPDIIFPYHGPEPSYILGAMGGPGPIDPKLTPEQIAKVDLLESFLALSVQCLSGDIREEILACDVLEKFGNRLSDTKKDEIEDFKHAEEDLDMACTIPPSERLERLPLEKIEALVDITIEDKVNVLNKVRQLLPEVREYLLHRLSVFPMIYGRIPFEHIGKIREKVLAYYIYANKIPDLLSSSNLENHRK